MVRLKENRRRVVVQEPSLEVRVDRLCARLSPPQDRAALGRHLDRLVGPGCKLTTLRQRIAVELRDEAVTEDEVRGLVELIRGRCPDGLIFPNAPRSAAVNESIPARRTSDTTRLVEGGGSVREKQMGRVDAGAATAADRAFSGLPMKERKGLVKARRRAEAFLKEPLPVFIRRLMKAGKKPREITAIVARRSNSWALLSPIQIEWLSRQPVPSEFSVPPKPRQVKPNRRGRRPEPRGFWASIRNEKHVHSVRGGLPGLGKRR